jgi:hypothetical protein
MVANSWARLEFLVDLSALELARVDGDVGWCFTTQIAGSGRKLDAYIAIAKLRGADSFTGELEAFAKDTAGLAAQRNRIVHDPWRTYGLVPERLEVTARKKLRRVIVSMSSEEVMACNDRIVALYARFCELHEKIMVAIDT